MSRKLLRILSVFAIVALLAATTASIVAAPPPQGVVACEEEVIVGPGDWLSKLADKYYGDALAYPAIFEATNANARVDTSYARLDDANQIEVGQRLCIPSVEDAQMLLQKWDGLRRVSSSCVPVESIGFVPQEPIRLERGQAFVDREIMLTGLIVDVNTVVSNAEVASLEMTPIARISYEGIAVAQSRPFTPPLRFPSDRAPELTTQLYRIGSGSTVSDAIQTIYRVVGALREEKGLDAWVYAEPNYVTNSPLSSEGWDPGGSPLSGAVGPATDFYQQWGLGVVSGTHVITPTGRTIDTLGDGTQVVILDTSLFYLPGPWEFGPPRWPEQQEDAQALLRICVSHPVAVAPIESPLTYTNVSTHGVFVAGLVHAVAPHSQIQLIRVLNDEGQGTLFSLAEALIGAITTTLQSHPVAEQENLEKTVINLSLGLHPPENPEDVGITEEELTRIRNDTDAIAAGLPPEARAILDGLPPNGSDNIPIVALETPLAIAYSYGAVIVAAAGNESGPSPANMPQPALRPASYPVPFVIGVAASDQALGRSCFSNAGDIAAPGGGLDPNPTAPRDCTPSAFTDGLRTCSGSGRDCPYGVISFSPSVTTTGYALWSGTSFATPQVSGLAALLLQQNVSAQEVFTEMLTTPITDTHLGKGIVDVDQTVP